MTHAMPPDPKSKLAATINKLREQLLADFHNAADGTYRLSVPINKAELSEEHRVKRRRLEAWLDEQARRENGGKKTGTAEIRERHYRSALKLAAATFLNRIAVIRHKEAVGLIKPAVVTGGWNSPGYRELRDFAPGLLKDETEGYAFLLSLVFDELALDLPGLFGEVGISRLFPVPAVSWRAVVEAFDDADLESVWTDDTTLGWIYQFWNDPDRRALDDKIRNRGKIERHEIAAKTQLFTERYMVEWLLQNSLNPIWMAICQKHGWTPKGRSEGVLDALAARRAKWREMRAAGEVTPEEMMPIESDAENRWKYYVDGDLSAEFIDAAPDSVRDLKLLDPAVGSGHFLIIAFELLAAFYHEEAGHRGETWPDQRIAESIIENNLHGIDIDPRAVQIAAAALWLKAKRFCRSAAPKTMNLVASNLGLAALPPDDPAVEELKAEVESATGIPEALTDKIIHALKGADYLGSLLKIDEAVDEAIRAHEREAADFAAEREQGLLFDGFRPEKTALPFNEAKGSVLEKLDRFLEKRTTGEDLGLRLRGEQLAAGVRFIRVLKPGRYDVVVANPPYLGGGKMFNKAYIDQKYPEGKADLYSVFLQRGADIVRRFGLSAMITIRGWMFIKDYEKLRKFFIEKKPLICVADLHFGAFPEMKDVSVTMSVTVNENKKVNSTQFIRPVKSELIVRNFTQIQRNLSGLVAPHEIFTKSIFDFDVIQGQPFIYWWSDDFFDFYSKSPKLGEICRVRKGATTSNNKRFIRFPWEIKKDQIMLKGFVDIPQKKWVPYILGAKGKNWYEPLDNVINWADHGLEIKVYNGYLYGSYTRSIQNQDSYFKNGVAFATIGNQFSARIHRYESVIDSTGSSLFPENLELVCCLLNAYSSRHTLSSLNPTIHFKNHDINRLPFYSIKHSDLIFSVLNESFTIREMTREPSVEFKQPGPSAWTSAQNWAQAAVDRPSGAPLPPFEPVYEDPPPTDYVSFAVGVALGRFGADGEGILDEAPETALPDGILYLSAYSDDDGPGHPASRPIHDAWAEHGEAVAGNLGLKTWLREKFFKDVHLGMYEKRPIYFPLSSKKKHFVAFVSIHRWTDATLQTLLADHLITEQNRLEGEIRDLSESRERGHRKAQAQAESRYARVQGLHEELTAFIGLVRACAESGPPPAGPSDTPREADARFRMDLDDGVMVNSAALWPLLEPQWKDPKKWWSELSNAKGRKDYDWSHLAARYFPDRVDRKCRTDPSLAVAHGCFWTYHPARAYQWELRLQDEIAPWFTIDEDGSDELAAAFEEDHRETAEALVADERRRRERNRARSESAGAAPSTEKTPAETRYGPDPLFSGDGRS